MSRINKKTPAKCAICGKEFDSYIKLARHLQYTHKMKSKEYFDKYVEPFEHICRICHKNPTKFININDGYSDICSEKTCKLEKIAQIKEKGMAIETIIIDLKLCLQLRKNHQRKNNNELIR